MTTRTAAGVLRGRRIALAACLVVLVAGGRQAGAVIVVGSAAGNTSPPTDPALANRWSQVGNFDGYLGTPIAPQFFVTAKHLGDLTGQPIVFPDATSYPTVSGTFDPASDLAIYQISGTFPAGKIVPMYAGSFSAGQPLYVFGRGVPRTTTDVIGDEFPSGTGPKGWTWGSGTGARTWGTNTLDGTAPAGAAGVQLVYDFDLAGGGDQGVLSVGDSGGPVFIQESGEWRLAGINYAVESIFNTGSSGVGVFAAIFDKGGLYASNNIAGPWTYDPPGVFDDPASSYSTSIPDRSAWIASALVPEPSGILAALVGIGGGGLLLRRRLLSGR